MYSRQYKVREIDFLLHNTLHESFTAHNPNIGMKFLVCTPQFAILFMWNKYSYCIWFPFVERTSREIATRTTNDLGYFVCGGLHVDRSKYVVIGEKRLLTGTFCHEIQPNVYMM